LDNVRGELIEKKVHESGAGPFPANCMRFRCNFALAGLHIVLCQSVVEQFPLLGSAGWRCRFAQVRIM